MHMCLPCGMPRHTQAWPPCSRPSLIWAVSVGGGGQHSARHGCQGFYRLFFSSLPRLYGVGRLSVRSHPACRGTHAVLYPSAACGAMNDMVARARVRVRVCVRVGAASVLLSPTTQGKNERGKESTHRCEALAPPLPTASAAPTHACLVISVVVDSAGRGERERGKEDPTRARQERPAQQAPPHTRSVVGGGAHTHTHTLLHHPHEHRAQAA